MGNLKERAVQLTKDYHSSIKEREIEYISLKILEKAREGSDILTVGYKLSEDVVEHFKKEGFTVAKIVRYPGNTIVNHVIRWEE